MLQPTLRRERYGGCRGRHLGRDGAERGVSAERGVKVTRGWPRWGRRLSFAAILLVAAVTPGMAAGWSSSGCPRAHCERAGSVRWIRPMPGSWTVQNGLVGTNPAGGQAYAALGSQVAVVGA